MFFLTHKENLMEVSCLVKVMNLSECAKKGFFANFLDVLYSKPSHINMLLDHCVTHSKMPNVILLIS